MRSRTFAALSGALLVALAATGCSGSASSGNEGGDSAAPIKVGVIVAQSGIYASVGEDMLRGFQTYLDENSNKLGGHPVELTVVDEGADAQSGAAAATRMAQQENVDVVVGIVTGPTAMASRDIFDGAQIPVLLGNTGSIALGGEQKSDWMFRIAGDNRAAGQSLGEHLTDDTSVGDFYLIAPDYSGGHEIIDGFKQAFPADRIKGEVYTPFGTTSDYSPFLAKIKASGAKSVFAFYAGAEAIEFTKQFSQFGLNKTVTLYGAGYLTDGSALEAEGDAALGVYNSVRYNWDLDNPQNKKFVEDFESKYSATPSSFSGTMFDVGVILNAAVGNIQGDLSRQAIRDAVANLGPVDGVRGELQIDKTTNAVVQPYYLTQAKKTSNGLENVTLEKMGPAYIPSS